MVRVFIIVLIFILDCANIHAQPKITFKDHKADQDIIDNYIRKLNKELVYNDINYKDKNKQDVIDSLIEASRSKYNEGYVTYAPDNKFKVFVIKGEDCGAHCNCIYRAYIHIKESKTKQALTDDFLLVDAIFKLNDGKYLILQKSSSCGGNVQYDYEQATIISIKDGKIIYHPFNYKNPIDGTNSNESKEDGSLSLFQLMTDTNDNTVLKFNPKTKLLAYKYRNEACIYSGYFKYEQGLFLHKKEIKRIITSSGN
jgi:hypothetical protein